MAGFLDHLLAEMAALERSLEHDERYIKLRELRRVHALYDAPPGAASIDSPTLRDVQERTPRRRPTPREMAPATKRVIEEARAVLTGRSAPMPLRELHHEIAEVRGIPIGGNEPINNLSAMLYRYGFEAVGRTGWRLRQSADPASATDSEPSNSEPDRTSLLSAPTPNGLAHEIHGAATTL